MRVENIYIGTRANITDLVTAKHTEIVGDKFTLVEQLDQIDSTSNKFSLIFMKTINGPHKIDKWWVHLREEDALLAIKAA